MNKKDENKGLGYGGAENVFKRCFRRYQKSLGKDVIMDKYSDLLEDMDDSDKNRALDLIKMYKNVRRNKIKGEVKLD